MSENSTGKLRSLTEKLNFPRRKASAENQDISSERLPESTAKPPVSDDAFVEVVFSKAYELLPAPVRIVLKREWCLSYLQSQKAPILVKLQLYRAGKLSSAELSALPLPDSEKATSQIQPSILP